MSRKKKKGKKGGKTVSQRQLEANRQNAQQSTGPKTREGKEISSQNATTHGAYAGKRLIAGEDPEVFSEYYDLMLDFLEPDNPLEVQYVDDYIWDCWRLDRLRSVEARLYEETATSSVSNLLKELNKLTTIKMRLERSRDKALKQFVDSRARTMAVKQGNHNGRRSAADFMEEVRAYCKPPEFSVEELMAMNESRQAQNPQEEGVSPPTEGHEMGSFQQTHPSQDGQPGDPPPQEPPNPENSG